MRKRKWLLLLGLSLNLLFTRIQAAEFNVTPISDDDCSDFNCNLQSALTEAENNGQVDTLILEAGIYKPTLPGVNFPNYDPASSEEFDLIIRGAGKGNTILDGSGLSERAGILRINSARNSFQVKGITFQNGMTSNMAGIFIEGLGSITIEDCEFVNNAGGAIISGNTVRIIDNIFSNNAPNGLEITSGAQLAEVQRNIFDSNLGGAGIAISSGIGTILNNVFANNFSTALSISSIDFAESTVTIANNSIAENQSDTEDAVTAGLMVSLDGDTSEACILNNIIRGSRSPSGKPIADIFFNAGIDMNGDGKGNLIQLHNNNFGKLSSTCFEGCSIPKEESGNINKDPLFVDPENGDFHLSPSSPCVNTGTADVALVDLPEFDLDGNPRIFGPAPDMGAYELQEEPSPNGSGSSGGCSLIP